MPTTLTITRNTRSLTISRSVPPAATIGPTSSTDNQAVRFNGTAGRIQGSPLVIADDGDLTGIVDLTMTGNLAVTGTVDGRDVATDGTKLDGIEALADVTDTANVSAAMISDPTGIGDNTASLAIALTVGAGSLSAGSVYYLGGSGWAASDASAAATATPMLGIALGASSASGVVVRGWVDAAAALSGFAAGAPVYLSETASSLTTTAPTTSGAIVRCVGHCSTTANLIWFDGLSTAWAEVA